MPSSLLRNRLLASVRDADWFDAARARGYCLILLLVSLAGACGYLALSSGNLDPTGKPLGTDFASFWTASKLALEGRAADAWSMARHGALQAETFGKDAGYAAFFYPPPYLLVCLPLAVLPYLLSLVLWLALTFVAWLRMVRGWLDVVGQQGLGLLPLFAFPAVMINAGHGQNGFLTAALLGGGALLQPSRPLLAGLLFGGLVIKPQLAVLLPIYLLMARDWRCILATGVVAITLCAVSLALLGLPAWQAFLANADNAAAVLSQNTVGYHKMQSAFAAARILGAPETLALTLQFAVIAAVLWVLFEVRKSGDAIANGAALCTGALLATPFVLDYDLTLLAVPLIWLYGKAQQDGFQPWERLALAAGFVLPLTSRPLATIYLPIAFPVMISLLVLIWRRSSGEAVFRNSGRAVS